MPCPAHRKPVLILHPQVPTQEGEHQKLGWAIRLIPALPEDLFPCAKLGPERNNLRSATAAALHAAQHTLGGQAAGRAVAAGAPGSGGSGLNTPARKRKQPAAGEATAAEGGPGSDAAAGGPAQKRSKLANGGPAPPAGAPAVAAAEGDAGLLPTPLYNAGVLQDVLQQQQDTWLGEGLQRLPQLREVVMLLEVRAHHSLRTQLPCWGICLCSTL